MTELAQDLGHLLQDLLKGDTRALARAITRVENRTADSLEILRQLYPLAGKAQVIGVTGSPGSGKSSLVDRLAAAYRQQNNIVGIVAVDPSSPFTGGAILGDRIRMQTFGVDPGVYIRSMATRGQLGGLARASADVVTVLDAARKNPILVETVGVGQDEVEIVKLADISIVVLVPGMGDDVQALKAGIMEIGDIFVINKCDRAGVEKMEHAVSAMLSLAHRVDGWNPPVVKTIATEGRGIDELVAVIGTTHQSLRNLAVRAKKKRDVARQHLMSLLQERLVTKVLNDAFPDGQLDGVIEKIADRRQDPYSVVDQLIGGIEFRK